MKTILMLLLAFVLSTAASERRRNIQLAKRDTLVRSKRRWVLTTIELVEEDPGPYPKYISQIFNDKTHQHNNHNYVMRGMGVDEEPLGVFSLDQRSGKVYAHRAIDREKHSFFHIKFDILDIQTGRAIDKELAFDVDIKDINDNAPKFRHPQMSADVMENTLEGYLPVRIEVSDHDQENTPNSTVTLSVISQSPQVPKFELHQIDSRMAQLTFEGCFDYNKVKKYEVILQAKDDGKPSLSSTAVVTLNIIDANSHPPMFKARKYHGEIPEMVTRENVLRLVVEDKDTPKTPGWRAKYFIIKGNEENNYKIETDPDTNDGILSVIKGKDFEKSATANLQIGVENEEPLFVCKDGAPLNKDVLLPDSINVTMKVIDVNDPPQFEKNPVDIYEKEEEEPGKLLYTTKVDDVDSDRSKIRFVLLDDPADWVTIDRKTGQIRTTKKMDRESPFVHDDVYKILIAAQDDGVPPATSTGTILVHLLDINDNKPMLSNNSVTLCGNKVMLDVKDLDSHPYSGPFTVSLKSDDATRVQRWKVDPSTGEEVGLVSLRTLAYGHYSVPLVIEDQQGITGEDIVVVTVCDCEGGGVCRQKHPLSTSLGPAGIGLIFASLLLFLLILFILKCEHGKQFEHFSDVQQQGEGHQTLIQYNQEGGGAECKISSMTPAMIEDLDSYKSRMINHDMVSLGQPYHGESFRNNKWHNVHSTLSANKNLHQGGSLKYQRPSNLLSNHLSDHLNRRLHTIDGNFVNHPEYAPHEYVYEGEESRCQSLDELSFSICGEDLGFLNDLGPKFKPFGNICNQIMQEKGICI